MSVLDWVGVGIVSLIFYTLIAAYICGLIDARKGKGSDDAMWSLVWPIWLIWYGLLYRPCCYLSNLGYTSKSRREIREKARLR